MATADLHWQHKTRDLDGVSRNLDFIIACLALVVLSPLMLLIALGIVVESGRPVLFSQLRLGQYGRPFRIHKFRKFHKECGTTGTAVCPDDDKRLTALGKLLRLTKLDELPQLWNVLRGDMSIVGPRPETLAFADSFTAGFERVLEHKPGIFGPTQVMFRNEGSLYPSDVDPSEFYRAVLFPNKARIDLAYYEQRTIRSDIAWFFRGVLATLGWVPSTLLRPEELLACDHEAESTSLTALTASCAEVIEGPPRHQRSKA